MFPAPLLPTCSDLGYTLEISSVDYGTSWEDYFSSYFRLLLTFSLSKNNRQIIPLLPSKINKQIKIAIVFTYRYPPGGCLPTPLAAPEMLNI